MEIGLQVIVIVLLIIIIALSAFMLYREFSIVIKRMDDIEKKSGETIEAMNTRIKTLEEANRKRMPWDALEKLEHAQAALDLEEFERELGLTRIKNAKEWLRMTLASGTKREDKS